MRRLASVAAGIALLSSLMLTSGAAAQTSPSAVPAPPPITPGVVPTALESLITGTAPASETVTVNTSSGGVAAAGNTAFSFPPGAFGAATGNVTINITTANLSTINIGGASQFSPNGTVIDISITDSNGTPITTFPQAITAVLKPNAADLGIANGNFGDLTLFYVVDALSPLGENPNHYPVNTRVVVAPSVISIDPVNGFISANLNFLGSPLGVGTNPAGYVQTLNPKTSLLSSFDTSNAQSFGIEKQFSFLQVVEPQIGDTLMVLNPATGNYAYVKASDVGPSGPPPNSGGKALVGTILGS